MDRSGRDELTLAFGLTAINDRAAAGNHVFVRMLMETLVRDERPEAAVEVRCEPWQVSEAGWIEADTVALCGGSMEGSFMWAVSCTDIPSSQR